MALIMDLRVECTQWQTLPDLETVCQRAFEAGLTEHGYKADAQLDVVLGDDALLADLNAQWRGKTGPTDVLSFPATAQPNSFLGDIAIAYGVASSDAKTGGKTLPAHLSHLLIHGLLHLLGHDHIEDEDAKRMEHLERAALARLGIDDPYSRIVPN